MPDRASRRRRRTDQESRRSRADRIRTRRERRSRRARTTGRETQPGDQPQQNLAPQRAQQQDPFGQQSWMPPQQQAAETAGFGQGSQQPTQYGQQPQQAIPQGVAGFQQFTPGGQTQQPVSGAEYEPAYQQLGQPQQGGQPVGQPGGDYPQQLAGTPTAGQQQLPPQQLADQPEGVFPEKFVDHLNEEMRICLDDCIDVSQVAAWCADLCIDEGRTMSECSRLCHETAELGALAAEFISRDAKNLPAVIEAYAETAESALEELETHDQPHTKETAAVIDRSIESSLNALETM